jgi:hypothetical protein
MGLHEGFSAASNAIDRVTNSRDISRSRHIGRKGHARIAQRIFSEGIRFVLHAANNSEAAMESVSVSADERRMFLMGAPTFETPLLHPLGQTRFSCEMA